MNEIMELRSKRKGLVDAMRAILDKAGAETRALNAEEQQEYDRMESEVRDLKTRIDALEHQRELESEATAEERNFDPREARGETVRVENFIESEEYNEAFIRYCRFGIQDVEHRDVLRVGRDTLTGGERRDQAVGTNNLGGFTVPTSFQRQLVEHLVEAGAVRQTNVTVLQTGSGEALQVPKGTAHGDAEWLAEAQPAAVTNEMFGQATLDSFKAVRMVKISIELLEDNAVNLTAYLSRQIGDAIGRLENTAFVNGDGSGKPTGFLQDAVLGKETASASAITADEIIDLIYSVIRPYRSRGEFLMADSTIAAIRKLKVDTNDQYIWQPGLQTGEPDRLLGYALRSDPDMPEIAATAQVIAFGDFSHYWIRDVGGFVLRRLDERFADNLQVGFLAYHRVDGLLVGDTNAIKTLTMKA